MTWIQSARRTGPQRHPDRGNTQLLDATQFGFGPRFLRHFEVFSSEESSVCGQALRRGAPMVVRDVACDPLIAGGPSLGVLLDAGVRNVYSVHRRAADDDPAMDHHRERLRETDASKVTVEFGCEFALESGSFVAVIGKASGKSTFKVGLEWAQKP